VEKLGFVKLKLNVIFSKSIKHFLQMLHVISWGQAKNNDVIDITFGKINTLYHWIHDPLGYPKNYHILYSLDPFT
jgi:hypothetical protein